MRIVRLLGAASALLAAVPAAAQTAPSPAEASLASPDGSITATFATDGDDFAMTIEVEFGWLIDSPAENGMLDFDSIWRTFVDSLGYHVERGHEWSWHFMSLPKFNAHS